MKEKRVDIMFMIAERLKQTDEYLIINEIKELENEYEISLNEIEILYVMKTYDMLSKIAL